MKKKYFSSLITLALLFLGITVAHAEEEISEEPIIIEETTTSTPIETIAEESETEELSNLPTTEATLRIETISGGEIVNESVTVTACKPYEASVEYTLNAKCLIDQAEGVASTWNYFGTDAFLDSVNGIANDFGANLFWGYFINNEYGMIALNSYVLNEGDEILLVLGVNPLKIEMDSLSPTLYTTTTLRVYEFGLDEFWSPIWLPSTSSTVLVDGIIYTTSKDGTAEIKFDTHETHTIQTTKDGFAKSNVLAVETTLPTIESRLYAVANSVVLFEDTITVTACKPYEASTEYTLNAKCLIDQAEGLTSTWDFYSTDAFLSSVNEYNNDFGANLFWGYFINSEYGSIALNAYILSEGDEILIQYNTIPLKLELSTTTPVVGDSVTISLTEFGLDEFWNPVWIPSTSSTVIINEISQVVSSSSLTFPITTTSTYTIRAEKEGYVTRETTFTPGEALVSSNPPSSGSSGGSGGTSDGTTRGAQGMINFLDAKQNTNGSFGTTAFLSDWAALAYGAWTSGSVGKEKLTNYLLTDPNPLDGPNKTTNYARRAMALMALGINPYTGTQTNYINEITKEFDGTQFGEIGLINDDIFALVPLLRSGYSMNDALIVSTTKYIIANQDTHGSFGSIDLTGAAIQALSGLSSIEGVSEALTKAKNYLTLAQQADGGFGNVYATGWVIQGITALGENAVNWNKNGNTPITYIQSKQASDGGMLSGDTDANRIWATSYALPGVLGKPWHVILSSFSKPTGNGSGENSPVDDSSSSTAQTVSSTPVETNSPTSTPPATTTLEVETNPIIITTMDETVTKKSTTVSKETPTNTIVLGERIEENTTSTIPAIPETIPETTELTNNIESDQNSSIKKYIFGISLVGLVGLLGYALWSSKKS